MDKELKALLHLKSPSCPGGFKAAMQLLLVAGYSPKKRITKTKPSRCQRLQDIYLFQQDLDPLKCPNKSTSTYIHSVQSKALLHHPPIILLGDVVINFGSGLIAVVSISSCIAHACISVDRGLFLVVRPDELAWRVYPA